jgi:hypothetical protein
VKSRLAIFGFGELQMIAVGAANVCTELDREPLISLGNSAGKTSRAEQSNWAKMSGDERSQQNPIPEPLSKPPAV